MESEKISKCSKQEARGAGRAKEKRALLIPFLEPVRRLLACPPQQKETLNPTATSIAEVKWNVLTGSPELLALSSMPELKQPLPQGIGTQLCSL